MPMGQLFGRKVRELRIKNSLLQRELAERVGMEVTYLSRIEAGKIRPPSEAKILAMAEILGADADELLLLAQRLPKDIPEAIHQSPKVPEFLRSTRGLSDAEWDELIRFAKRLRGEQS